jgi:hypothetical protein
VLNNLLHYVVSLLIRKLGNDGDFFVRSCHTGKLSI